jgi:hypothetical protein
MKISNYTQMDKNCLACFFTPKSPDGNLVVYKLSCSVLFLIILRNNYLKFFMKK